MSDILISIFQILNCNPCFICSFIKNLLIIKLAKSVIKETKLIIWKDSSLQP